MQDLCCPRALGSAPRARPRPRRGEPPRVSLEDELLESGHLGPDLRPRSYGSMSSISRDGTALGSSCAQPRASGAPWSPRRVRWKSEACPLRGASPIPIYVAITHIAYRALAVAPTKHASDSLPAKPCLSCYPPRQCSAWLDGQGEEDNNRLAMNECEAVLTKIAEHRAELTRLGVRSLALFGSTARGEARVDSDVDLLVDFTRPVGLFGFLEVKSFLEHLLGRPVDLVTASALRPDYRDTVLREAVHAG